MTITHKDKFYIYAADICDCIHNAVCCDYNNAHVFLYELIDEIPESHYPVKGCILNNNFDVVYKTEVKGKNDSKGRSNRTDKT